MNMQASAQASAPATERPTAPVRGRAGRYGAGEAVAVRSEAVPQEANPSAPPESEPEPTGEWAICCSGGGIRSATYCLGGLQSLDELGPLGRAKWIVGVSGGSYIAASRALVAEGLHRAKEKRAAEGEPQAKDAPRPYARGTAEEDNLRNDTHYIAPDAKTVLVAILSLLLGSVLTCIVVLAPLYALGHAWGWLLRAQGVLTWSGNTASASVSAWNWWLAVPALAALITLVLFLRWWATLASGGPGRGVRRARGVGWAGAITAGLGVLMLAVPPVIDWLYHSTGALGKVVHFFGIGGTGHWSLATLGGLIAAITAVARSAQKQLAKLSQPSAGSPAGSNGKAATGSSSGAAGQPATGSSSSMIGKLVTWARGTLAPWLASFVILAIGAFATLLFIGTAARVGYSLTQLWHVLIAVAIVFVTRAMVDVNRTSLHDFYRWRLTDAYAVTREAAEAEDLALRQKLFAEAAATRLSQLRNQGDPALVIATTANINVNREVPAGRGGFCLAFDQKNVILRADPRCGEKDVKVATTDYEHLLGHTRFTLFDIVAISGAAFSPLMGAATRHAYRILLTLTNLRLGVWMPHPLVVSQAREYANAHDGQVGRPGRIWLLLLWYVLPHPFWRRNPDKQQKRENELWAHVLKLREDSTEGKQRPPLIRARLRAAVCWRVMQPTLGLLWAEAFGHTSYRATWVNVTDGGHYDNLGLVEALRREAKNIVVLDASGDSPHTWFTLGGAMALARADAQVNITLDPSTMIRPDGHGAAPTLSKGQVLRPWANGTFTRSNGHAANGEQATTDGRLWVCKLGWWEDAPWDVRAYAAGHPTYPCDPTMQQLYDGAEFDAYHELGFCSMAAAIASWQLPVLQNHS
jgi:hypothetical protein